MGFAPPHSDPELRKIEHLVASTLAHATRSNSRAQMYVARRKYEGVRHREGWGGYLAEVVTHTLSGKSTYHNVFKVRVRVRLGGLARIKVSCWVRYAQFNSKLAFATFSPNPDLSLTPTPQCGESVCHMILLGQRTVSRTLSLAHSHPPSLPILSLSHSSLIPSHSRLTPSLPHSRA